MVKFRSTRPGFKVTGDGTGVVNHAGARVLADLGDRLGLTRGLSAAMAPTRQRRRGHDRGRVLADMAVMLCDGGETITDLRVLRDQPDLFGEVASTSTAWRTLDAIGPVELDAIAAARLAARRRAWGLGMDPGFYVIDIDATLVNSHSEKQHAAPTYKRGFGFHPLVAYLDATGEALAVLLRRGNAGSGTATDHVTVLDAALAQLPIDPAATEVIVRTDSAGRSHAFLDACAKRNVRFVVGQPLEAHLANIAVSVPDRKWQTAISADGTSECDGREVTEITHLVDLSGWPPGTRMIARREEAHPGAQLTFTDVDGRRYQLLLTDLTDSDICYIEGVYRGRGRCEQRIADAKDTGLANLPSHDFAINTAWVNLVMIAQDLFAWFAGLGINPETDLARAEPKRIRYTLLHAAATITRSGRRTRLRFSKTWPWTQHLVDAFDRIHAIPLRT
jgi:hypothetical protein